MTINKYDLRLAVMVVMLALVPSLGNAATLIHRYTFNGNVNDSVGSVNGAVTGSATYLEAPTYVTAAPTGATGVTTAISLGVNAGTKNSGFSIANSALDQTAGAISFWINPGTASDSTSDYLLYEPSIGTGMHIYVSNPSVTNANLTARVGSQAGISASSVVTTGTWRNVALTWDSTNGINFYIDGTWVGTQALSSFTTTAGLRFGNFDLSNVSTYLGNQYTGYIYDFQSYSGALTAGEVSYLYSNPGLAVPEPSSLALCIAGALLFLVAMHKKNHEVS